MKKILTADNTETFLNEEVGESYHSQTGAVEEAFKKYAFPCKIKELAKGEKIKILDICSGMFYNSAAAIDIAWEENPNCLVEVVGLEKDLEIVKNILEVNPPIKSFKLFKEFLENNWVNLENNLKKTNLEKIDNKRIISYNKEKIKINLLMGDARERIKELESDSFDAVFLDPFSPKVCPEMWGADFFKEIFRVIKEKRILATYTCARLARENMKEAGFSYDDGPIVGRRGPGTVGWKEFF